MLKVVQYVRGVIQAVCEAVREAEAAKTAPGQGDAKHEFAREIVEGLLVKVFGMKEKTVEKWLGFADVAIRAAVKLFNAIGWKKADSEATEEEEA